MVKTDLGYEIENYYDKSRGKFVRDVKFIDPEGHIYAPLAVNEDAGFVVVDVGGADRQFSLKSCSGDLIHSINNEPVED